MRRNSILQVIAKGSKIPRMDQSSLVVQGACVRSMELSTAPFSPLPTNTNEEVQAKPKVNQAAAPPERKRRGSLVLSK